jgi:hypothetical protein
MKIVALSAVLLLLCLVAVSSADEFDFFYLVQQVSKNPSSIHSQKIASCVEFNLKFAILLPEKAMNLMILVWFVVAWILL